MTGELPTRREALIAHLAAIAQGPELIEFRYRRAGGMGQIWEAADHAGAVAETILSLSATTDVYVGATGRTERDGSKRAVAHARALWVDCDDPDASERLRDFTPAPTLILRSGRDHALHGWWALRDPLPARHLEAALRRIAHHLGGDMACTDTARIMRPAGTFNHRHGDPRPVEVEHLTVDLYDAADVVGRLPDPPATRPPARDAPRPAHTGDALLAIPATVYVPALTGREPGPDGKIACPFHDDRTPSLHAYPDPERGWTCYAGCGGGTIIDFAAHLYGIEPRGAGYRQIRDRLEHDLRGAR